MNLSILDGRAELWQWDTGVRLVMDEACEAVNISASTFGVSVDVTAAEDGKTWVAAVPDEMLQVPGDLICYAVQSTATGTITAAYRSFRVNRRPKPYGYVATPTEARTWQQLYDLIEQGGGSVQPDWAQNDETAADYVRNRPGGYTAYDIKTLINDTFAAEPYRTPNAEIIAGMKYYVSIEGENDPENPDDLTEHVAVRETVTESGQTADIVRIGSHSYSDFMSDAIENAWLIAMANVGTVVFAKGDYVDKGIYVRGPAARLVKIPEEMLDLADTRAAIDTVQTAADNAQNTANGMKTDVYNAKVNASIARNTIDNFLNTRTLSVGNYKFIIGQQREGLSLLQYGYAIQYVNGTTGAVSDRLNILPTGIEFGESTDAGYAVFGPRTFQTGAYRQTSYARIMTQSGKGATDSTSLQLGDYETDNSIKLAADGTFYVGSKLLLFNTTNIEDYWVTLRGVKTPERDSDAANKKYVDAKLTAKSLKWVTVHSSDLTEETTEIVVSTDADGKAIADYNPVGLALVLSTPADATQTDNNGSPWVYPSATKADNVIRAIGSIAGWKTVARDSVFAFYGGGSAMTCTGNASAQLATYKIDGYALDGVRAMLNGNTNHFPVGTHVEVSILCEV